MKRIIAWVILILFFAIGGGALTWGEALLVIDAYHGAPDSQGILTMEGLFVGAAVIIVALSWAFSEVQ